MTAAEGRPMVAGNWKMNTTPVEGIALAAEVARRCVAAQVEVAVLPPFTHLWAVAELLRATAIRVGAQDLHWEDWGAFTGEVSAPMLAGWCDLVLTGHSERRHIFGETDAQSAAKFWAARRHGLTAILAVGETEAERDRGETTAVIDRQLDAVVADPSAVLGPGDWLVAYEPVWAIGTGRTATPEQAEEVCAHIAAHLTERLGGAPRILYGGSVTAATASELFAQPSIAGGLIGGASLRVDEFAAIVDAAAAAAG